MRESVSEKPFLRYQPILNILEDQEIEQSVLEIQNAHSETHDENKGKILVHSESTIQSPPRV